MTNCCNEYGQCTRGHGCPSGPKKQTLWLDLENDGEPLEPWENTKLWLWVVVAMAALMGFARLLMQLTWGMQ